MICRVKLALLHHTHQVRKLKRGHALRLEQGRKPGAKVVDVGYVRQHVVGRHQVRLLALRCQFLGKRHAKELFNNGDALCFGSCRCACGGFYAVAGDGGLLHILQQVAVIGGNFNHHALGVQIEALLHSLHIGFGVRQPRGRKRAEIGIVVTEERLTTRVVFGLHQPAIAACQHLERVPGLGRIQRRTRQIGIGRRRTAQIQKRQGQFACAMATLHKCTPLKLASSIAWPESRGERFNMGNGQLMARRPSRGFSPASACAKKVCEWQ